MIAGNHRSAPLWRSQRKRETPDRYDGGVCNSNNMCRDVATKKPRHESSKAAASHANDALPQTLPQEILCNTLSFVCSVKDRFALQCTCKVFRQISNSAMMQKNMELFNVRNGRKNGVFIRPEDSSADVSRRLLPFARDGNRDAIYVLGMIATYIEDDLKCGLALLQRGANEGDSRAMYEIWNMLQRRNRHDPRARIYLDNAQTARHGLAVAATMQTTTPVRVRKQALQELKATQFLKLLVAKKPKAPNASWDASRMTRCCHPTCARVSYRTIKRLCRQWLREKPLEAEWQNLRSQLLPIGVNATDNLGYLQDEFFYVPEIRLMCGRCHTVQYCSRSCQVLHWKTGHNRKCVARQQND